ncbi:MAG: hypothetical protein LBN32_02770 [Helicobacteraceae bacterium]|jgi:hypothetical protein|nr:hypothetical protein [Helicobacteraceae bacterium]
MDNLDRLRWIDAPLEIEFGKESDSEEAFRLEFDRFAESDGDPLSEWLKLARSRGETKESDPVLLALVVDLHRKVDELYMKISGETKTFVPLPRKERISGLNYTHFNLIRSALDVGSRYYARIKMPVFPMRDIGLFFTAQSDTIGEISAMHERDQNSWNSYVASRERVLIRQQKALIK